MQKPNVTKQLSLYSAICAAVCMLLQTTAVILPHPFIRLYSTAELDLPWRLRFMLMPLILVRLLPICIFAFWSWMQNTTTHGKSLTTVILAPILYIAGVLMGTGVLIIEQAFFSRRETTAVISAFGIIQSVMNLVSFLGIASLVLLCCAGAIELYLTTHTPSDGEGKEVTL